MLRKTIVKALTAVMVCQLIGGFFGWVGNVPFQEYARRMEMQHWLDRHPYKQWPPVRYIDT